MGRGWLCEFWTVIFQYDRIPGELLYFSYKILGTYVVGWLVSLDFFAPARNTAIFFIYVQHIRTYQASHEHFGFVGDK